MDALRHCLTADPNPHPSANVESWWAGQRAVIDEFDVDYDAALVGGFRADRVAFAFAAGYQAALAWLFPILDRDRKRALCITEAAGNHPRAIETRVEGASGAHRLTGTKQFVTLGTFADELIVAASIGIDDQGRNRLRMVQVPANAIGVTFEPTPELPFVPEIPHSKVLFDRVLINDDAILEGDGYADFVKPFRTIEDIFVHIALIGYLIRIVREARFPEPVHLESLLTLATSFAELATRDPNAIETHLALAGALRLTRSTISAFEGQWRKQENDPELARWSRDRALLEVASKAREKRRLRAWERLS